MPELLQSAAKGRHLLVLGLCLLVLAGVTWTTLRTNRKPRLPTAEVKRSEFVDYLELRGQVKAIHSVVVTAPSDAEDLQILHLVHEGARVKKGDMLVEFDATKLKATLAQDRSVLRGAEAGAEQTRALSRITLEGDRTELLKAGYDVDSAKLDASKGEIVSRIEGAEDELVVKDDQSKLAASDQKSKSDKTGADADYDGQKHKSDKAAFDVKQGEHRISVLTLRAPLDGIVTILPNYRAGGFFGGGEQSFKEGDQAWPGAGIVEIPDLSTLRIDCRIEESDRARVALNQGANVRVDALPDRELSGRVARISALATVDFSGGWPFPKNFELGVGLDQSDPRLRPGMNATARIAVEKISNAIVIPAEAAFQKSGETVAYVLRGSKFDEQAIEVGKRGESQLVVTAGLKPGERVALKDPTEKE
jgi:HlyD family secretion protein